jgi:hypothetical protein
MIAITVLQVSVQVREELIFSQGTLMHVVTPATVLLSESICYFNCKTTLVRIANAVSQLKSFIPNFAITEVKPAKTVELIA